MIFPRTLIVIPLVIHVLWSNENENISDQRIQSQIERLNWDFTASNYDLVTVPKEFQHSIGSINLKFCIAYKTENENTIYGVIRKKTDLVQIGTTQALFSDSLGGSSPWDQNKYLNIWIANTGGFVSGISSYPWTKDSVNDGVIIHPEYFGNNQHMKSIIGRVATHEIGHYFGLLHTWGLNSDCDEDDNIEDTPAQTGPYFNCPSYPQSSCSKSEMFMNYMDYTDDNCRLLFTKNQVERMKDYIMKYRSGLLEYENSCNPIFDYKRKPVICFPVPTTDVLKIKSSNFTIGIISLKLFDNLGRLLREHEITGSEIIEYNMGDFPSGLYYLRCNEETIPFIKI